MTSALLILLLFVAVHLTASGRAHETTATRDGNPAATNKKDHRLSINYFILIRGELSLGKQFLPTEDPAQEGSAQPRSAEEATGARSNECNDRADANPQIRAATLTVTLSCGSIVVARVHDSLSLLPDLHTLSTHNPNGPPAPSAAEPCEDKERASDVALNDVAKIPYAFVIEVASLALTRLTASASAATVPICSIGSRGVVPFAVQAEAQRQGVDGEVADGGDERDAVQPPVAGADPTEGPPRPPRRQEGSRHAHRAVPYNVLIALKVPMEDGSTATFASTGDLSGGYVTRIWLDASSKNLAVVVQPPPPPPPPPLEPAFIEPPMLPPPPAVNPSAAASTGQSSTETIDTAHATSGGLPATGAAVASSAATTSAQRYRRQMFLSHCAAAVCQHTWAQLDEHLGLDADPRGLQTGPDAGRSHITTCPPPSLVPPSSNHQRAWYQSTWTGGIKGGGSSGGGTCPALRVVHIPLTPTKQLTEARPVVSGGGGKTLPRSSPVLLPAASSPGGPRRPGAPSAASPTAAPGGPQSSEPVRSSMMHPAPTVSHPVGTRFLGFHVLHVPEFLYGVVAGVVTATLFTLAAMLLLRRRTSPDDAANGGVRATGLHGHEYGEGRQYKAYEANGAYGAPTEHYPHLHHNSYPHLGNGGERLTTRAASSSGGGGHAGGGSGGNDSLVKRTASGLGKILSTPMRRARAAAAAAAAAAKGNRGAADGNNWYGMGIKEDDDHTAVYGGGGLNDGNRTGGGGLMEGSGEVHGQGAGGRFAWGVGAGSPPRRPGGSALAVAGGSGGGGGGGSQSPGLSSGGITAALQQLSPRILKLLATGQGGLNGSWGRDENGRLMRFSDRSRRLLDSIMAANRAAGTEDGAGDT